MKLLRLSLIAITAASLLQADFTPSAWKSRKRIQLNGTPALASAVIDNEVWGAAMPRLHDLRVVRGAEEVPYVLSQMNAITENKRLDVELINKSVTPGGALEFTLDMQRAAKHNRIERMSIRTLDGNRRASALL